MELDEFETTTHQLQRPLLVVSGKRGVLACGYLSLEALEKNGDAAAIVRGVSTHSDMLVASVQDVTRQARQLGVVPGMSGKEALELFK